MAKDHMPDDEAACAFATRATVVAATSHGHTDVTEVHDFFTAIDAISYEGRGFAEQCGGCKSSKPRSLLSAGNCL
jgi:hypothetical protein